MNKPIGSFGGTQNAGCNWDFFFPESSSEPESKLITRDAYNTSDDEVNDDESNYRAKRGQDENCKEEAKNNTHYERQLR